MRHRLPGSGARWALCVLAVQSLWSWAVRAEAPRVVARPAASVSGDVAPRHKVRARPQMRLARHGRVHEVRFTPFDASRLVEEDRQWRGVPGVPERIGVNRPIPSGAITIESAGTWTVLDDGTILWGMRLVVPQARAVRLHFVQFDLPDHGRLLVAGAGDEPADVYTTRGPSGTGSFWSAPVAGPVVNLEYQAPADEPQRPIFRVDAISHIYRDPFAAQAAPIEGTAGVASTTVLPCHEDVNCHSVDPAARDAVGLMIFTVDSATYACTGTLLNDADPNTYAGYFLTANHCLSTQEVVDTLTVYWFYQTDQCDGMVPPLAALPKTLGGTLLATDSTSDFTFLRLADDPSDGQGFAAWTTATPSGQLGIIHHPQATHKRIAFGTTTTSPPSCGCCPLSNFWYLRLNLGAVENGSSGGPLFNENWEVVGQLYGACYYYGTDPGCDNYDEYNLMFGRFDVSYPLFSTYLNTITPDDAYEDNDSLGQAPNLEPGVYTLRLVDFDDYFAITLPVDGTVSAAATFDSSDMDLDLELLTESGQVLDESKGPGNMELVTATVTRGTYIVHVIKKHRWGGDYTLDLAAPRFVGDFDLDADVDMDDFAHLQECLSGPTTEQNDPACLNARLDVDLDVDLADVQLFQQCMSGPHILPPPACGP